MVGDDLEGLVSFVEVNVVEGVLSTSLILGVVNRIGRQGRRIGRCRE